MTPGRENNRKREKKINQLDKSFRSLLKCEDLDWTLDI